MHHLDVQGHVGHVAELPDHGLEPRRIEGAGTPLEVRIAQDQPPGFGIGLSEPQPPRFLVKGGLGDGLLQHLAVEAEGARLIGCQRPAELAADLLQPVGIEPAELFD